MIDLQCADVGVMLAALPDGSAQLIHADPPWKYSGGQEAGHNGLAGHHYDGLSEAVIAAHLGATYRVAAPHTYLAVWCTFPKLQEWVLGWTAWRTAWVSMHPQTKEEMWEYVSGATWGKMNGLGVGYHFRGDAEILLLYKKGTPKPLNGSKSNLWLADRLTHSEKPQTALRALVQMGAPPHGLVVDCYAGASASLARACRALGRSYVGAELDPVRHALALQRLSQQEMFSEGVA